jgi:hypothetical protein
MGDDMYNFNENLFILSENKIDINIAIKEWSILDVIFKKKIKDSNSIISKLSKKRITNEPVKCICQRNIHHYKILFNTITKEKINIGTGCIKKFKFDKKTKMSKFCENMINTLGYDKIDDVILYSNDIETEIAEYIKNCFTLIEKKNLSLKEQIKTYEDLETEIKWDKNTLYFELGPENMKEIGELIRATEAEVLKLDGYMTTPTVEWDKNFPMLVWAQFFTPESEKSF